MHIVYAAGMFSDALVHPMPDSWKYIHIPNPLWQSKHLICLIVEEPVLLIQKQIEHAIYTI